MTFTLWNSLGTLSKQTLTLIDGLLPPLCIYDLQGRTRYISQKFLQQLQVKPEKVDFFCYFPSLSMNLGVLQDYWQRVLQGEDITFTCNLPSPPLKLNCLLQLRPQENSVVLVAEFIDEYQPCILATQYEKAIFSLVNGSSSAIALTNSTGKVLNCNPRLYELLHIPAHNALNLEAFVHPDDRDLDHELKQRLLNHEIRSYTIEKRLVTDKQSVIWANFRVSQLNLPFPQPTHETYFAILIEDVTEQHKLYEALIRTEEKWKTFVLNSSHLFLQVSDIGHILYVSPAVERLLEYKEEELLDRSIVDLIHPDDLHNFGLAFKQWQIHHKLHSTHLEHVDLECRWQSKSKQWVYLCIQGQRFPMALDMEGIAISGYTIDDREYLEFENTSEKQHQCLGDEYSLQIVRTAQSSKRLSNGQYN